MCVAAAIAGGAIAGGLISSQGAQSAANTQAGAAENAQQISLNEFNTITGQEQPFMQSGYGAQNELNYLLGEGGPKNLAKGTSAPGGYGSLLQPFTAQTFKQYSPAYQFQQQQGMQGVLNGDTSGVGAESGAAQKDLMNYNQNLANTAFNNAFNQYQTQQGNIYQRLAGVAQMGQAAAANTGQQGSALAGQAAQSATNIGTAQAAGQVGVANAWSGALGGASYAPWLMQGAGGGGAAATTADETAMAYSDRRLKSDIKRVGTLESGLAVYRFRYGGKGPFVLGVMADEAETVFPYAVSEDDSGFKLVNYRAIR